MRRFFLENEKSAMDYIDTLISPEKKYLDYLNNFSSSSLSYSASTSSLSSYSEQSPKKKVKGILGIVKRTRSIHTNLQFESILFFLLITI